MMDERMKTPLEMVTEYQEVTQQVPNPDLYFKLIYEELGEFEESLKDKEEEQLKELSDLVYVIYGYAKARGWDLDMSVLRVHDNNMGRMYQPDGSILRREDGKIIKNKDYPKVDLSDLV